jgi:hypothetical protein
MPFQLFANNAESTLSIAVSSNTQATLTVQSGHGARFPSPTNADFFLVTLDDGTNIEVCKCVARSSDALTVLRGQEGSTAQSSFAIGTRVGLYLTEGTITRFPVRWFFDTKWIKIAANVASWQPMGSVLPTIVGGTAAGALTNSSFREQNERIRQTTSNSANTPASFRIPQPMISGQAGYRAQYRFGFALVPNSSHFFIGAVGTTGAVTSVHPPTSLFNAVVVGWDNAAFGTQLSVYHNDGSGNAVKVATNSFFTVTTQAWYEFGLEANPGGTGIEYRLRRLDISSINDFTGVLTTNIPANSLWLTHYGHGATMVASQLAWENGGVIWRT